MPGEDGDDHRESFWIHAGPDPAGHGQIGAGDKGLDLEQDRPGALERDGDRGADLAVALAIASAARGVPVKDGVASFGELGLTGRLRAAAQAERRLEECAKLGISAAVVPEGTTGRKGPRLVPAATLRDALRAALTASRQDREEGGGERAVAA